MPRRRLGQHFLRDRSVARRIVDAADIRSGDTVVEVGPGKGALTDLIVARIDAVGGRVVLIELDPGLAQQLQTRYADCDSVRVICGDARAPELHHAIRLEGNSGYKVIANLPYYAGTPIVRGFLERDQRPNDMVVMLQREVAQNMRARPGAMSLLSIAVQIYASADRLFDVAPESFHPRPEVHSQVLRIIPFVHPRVAKSDVAELFRLARFGFTGRRKQIHNSLANGLKIPVDDLKSMAASVGIDTTRRPATLSLDEWLSLLSAWRKYEESRIDEI